MSKDNNANSGVSKTAATLAEQEQPQLKMGAVEAAKAALQKLKAGEC